MQSDNMVESYMSDPIESHATGEGTLRMATANADVLVVDLATLIEKAQAHHPDIALPRELFVTFLQRCLRTEPRPPTALEALHIEDLYLACAYGLGIEFAQKQVEAEHFTRIQRRLERMQTPPSTIADILQELRCRLIEMQQPEFSGRAYSGRGSLGGWLFIAAIRIADRRADRARQELPEHERRVANDVQDRLLPALDPEMEHLVHSYKATFEVAMQQGLAALSCRERNLLRYHFLERLSIDRLAEIYEVHRATAARWIIRAQRRLADETRARFTAQIPIAADSIPRLLALIRSKLDLSLSTILPKTTELET